MLTKMTHGERVQWIRGVMDQEAAEYQQWEREYAAWAAGV